MLNNILTITGLIGILSLLLIAILRFDRFFYFVLIVKPFIDVTVNSTIVGDFNSLEISGVLIFVVALIKYVGLKNKSILYNHSFIWFFIILHLLSYLLAFNTGEQTFLSGLKFFIKLFNAYFIYFVAAADLMASSKDRNDIYRNIWYTTLIANIITIMVYYTGVSNTDTTRGLIRYNGLYNDPGTPSYLSVISLLFASLYAQTDEKNYNTFKKILYYFTWSVSLFVLYITLTKSALFMFVVFLLMWVGIYKKRFLLILPSIIIGSVLSFTIIEGVGTRFETEIDFIESGDSETAKSVGTGRVNRWETLLDQFNNEFDLPTRLLGTSKNFAAHNQYIAYLMQVGLIGLCVFIFILIRFYSKLIGNYLKNKSPEVFAAITFLSMFTVYGFTGHPFDYTTLLWYLMILLALINVQANEKRKKVREAAVKLQKLKPADMKAVFTQ
jgi:hypothetical protein